MRKLGILIAGTALLLSAIPAFAAGSSAPKATGGVGYTAGYQRYAEFNAIQTPGDCTTWNVTGNNTIDLTGAFTGYVYSVSFSLAGTTLTGTLTDPYFSPTPMAVTGTVIGNTITFSYTYPDGGFRGTRTFTGTITSGLVTDGTWSETGTEGLSGTWTNGTSFASVSSACTGKGVFNYHDINGLYYQVDVQYVIVVDTTAWFAGPVISGNVGAGNWLFAKVLDFGTPGSAGDLIWGSFVPDESTAKSDVVSMATPSDGPFAVTSGNLVVH